MPSETTPAESGTPTPFYRRLPAPLRVSAGARLQEGRGTLPEELFALAVFAAVPMEFQAWSVLRYPLLAIMLVLFFLWRRETIALARRHWVILILPAFYALSVLWSNFPYETMRFAVLNLLAIMTAILFACRLSHRQVVVAVMLSQFVIALASLAYLKTVWVGGIGGGPAILGLFPQKNVVGGHMVIMIVAALTILLDARYRRLWRLVAVPAIALGLFYIFNARSATALIMLGLGTLGAVFFSGIWRGAMAVRGLRPMLVAGTLFAVCAGAVFLTSTQRLDPYTYTLDALNRDTTLTGRTDVWYFARQQIAERPLLGVGADAFWRAGVGGASQITAMFPQTEGNRFNFHNSIYEVIVHLGFVGLALWLAVWIYAMSGMVRGWWRDQHRLDAFFVILLGLVLVRSQTESEMYLLLNFVMMTLWTGVFLAFGARMDEPSAAGTTP